MENFDSFRNVKIMSQNNSNQKETKMAEINSLLKEVLYNSLAQAILKLIMTPFITLKIFLFFSILISTSLASYLVIESIINYLSFGVSTTSRTIYEQPTLFPKVTFCNVNKYTTQYAFDLNGTQKNGNLDNFSDEEKRKFGHDLNDILIECSFNNEKCSASDFTLSYGPVYGNCYTFNSNLNENGSVVNLRKLSIFGPKHGLVLTFYVNYFEKFLSNFDGYHKTGAVIRIDNNSYLSYYLDRGIFVSPGFNTYISVDREFKSMLPKPYSNCEKESNSNLYNLINQSKYEYTQQTCFSQCYQIYLARKYNCTEPNILSLFNASKCIGQMIKNDTFDSDFIRENCLLSCPLECIQNLYKTSITFNQLSENEFFLLAIRNNSNLNSDFIQRRLDVTKARESFVKVNIFYDSLSYTLSTESPQMNGVTLLGSIGGNLGLFLGVSVFSLCELIEVVLEIFFILKK